MIQKLNKLLDRVSEFLAHRKGLLPILGVILILVNFVLQFAPGIGWIAQSNLFLHLGIVISILGILIAWAL